MILNSNNLVIILINFYCTHIISLVVNCDMEVNKDDLVVGQEMSLQPDGHRFSFLG